MTGASGGWNSWDALRIVIVSLRVFPHEAYLTRAEVMWPIVCPVTAITKIME